MIKKIIIPILVLAIFSLMIVSYTQGQTKPYYSGDTIVFQEKIYIATANTGSLELFVLNDDQLDSIAKIKPFDERFVKYGTFHGVSLRQENAYLYVYAITDFSIYKYQLNNENQLSLVKTVKNSYWDWYDRIDSFGDYLITISADNVKIWSNDLQVINEYSFSNSEVAYNVRGNDEYLLNVQNNHIYIYSRADRSVVREIPINLKTNNGAHQIFLDNNNDIYIVDDYYAKKFNLDGRLLANFQHQDYEGYDMSASAYSQSVYFSNGIGVVKLNKDTFKLEDWVYTSNIADSRGWAMGMEVLSLNGDKIVVFNNSNILVLDDKLDKIASVSSVEEYSTDLLTETLYLNLDKNRAAPNTEIYLSGGGFLPNEVLKASLAGSENSFIADFRGRFTQKIIVPTASLGVYDIKVSGESSGLHYSISFEIE